MLHLKMQYHFIPMDSAAGTKVPHSIRPFFTQFFAYMASYLSNGITAFSCSITENSPNDIKSQLLDNNLTLSFWLTTAIKRLKQLIYCDMKCVSRCTILLKKKITFTPIPWGAGTKRSLIMVQQVFRNDCADIIFKDIWAHHASPLLALPISHS